MEKFLPKSSKGRGPLGREGKGGREKGRKYRETGGKCNSKEGIEREGRNKNNNEKGKEVSECTQKQGKGKEKERH